jgi:hypothetical protein
MDVAEAAETPDGLKAPVGLEIPGGLKNKDGFGTPVSLERS